LILLNSTTEKNNQLYYQTRGKNKFLGATPNQDDEATILTNSINVEDRKILNNVESIASLTLDQGPDSPDIKVTNVKMMKNADLQGIRDTNGTFVADESSDQELNEWQSPTDVPPITINQGTTIRIDKNINKNAILMKKLDEIKIKIEERFQKSDLSSY
jgi:hypothetical protein